MTIRAFRGELPSVAPIRAAMRMRCAMSLRRLAMLLLKAIIDDERFGLGHTMLLDAPDVDVLGITTVLALSRLKTSSPTRRDASSTPAGREHRVAQADRRARQSIDRDPTHPDLDRTDEGRGLTRNGALAGDDAAGLSIVGRDCRGVWPDPAIVIRRTASSWITTRSPGRRTATCCPGAKAISRMSANGTPMRCQRSTRQIRGVDGVPARRPADTTLILSPASLAVRWRRDRRAVRTRPRFRAAPSWRHRTGCGPMRCTAPASSDAAHDR